MLMKKNEFNKGWGWQCEKRNSFKEIRETVDFAEYPTLWCHLE